MVDTDAPIIVYGGNGFVGSAICELVVEQGIPCISVSRRGLAPTHLKPLGALWADAVRWLQGDALAPDITLLQGARAIISLVGSPPLPTFSQSAFDHQLMMNGTSQVRVIQAAKEAGVNRLVMMGADIPALLQTDSFAYYLGKKQTLTAAKTFAASSKNRQAAVLQPAGIYGTRYTPVVGHCPYRGLCHRCQLCSSACPCRCRISCRRLLSM
ncbi:SDR family oxidoreductase [Oceanicoccus sagamiensis]|uniref:NAD-dependent epimerase/dehydratase domain-containing protein n=1 Tax=Oceanicoccus sagamiensis TaxID=716816 RepID=A0A1X9N9T4_9GAMM|nr:NAD-dependent epimerase/dehydratase family protein [Oceanicoccus sagamiensis]ARN74820.1 hypothetical protein BST96_12250 [Oceanicoccus sagamiensis]